MAGWHHVVLGESSDSACQLARESLPPAIAGMVPLWTANAMELSAKGLLHSQEQVLDMMVLRLAWVLLDTTVGCERKCYKMKETVDVIKNVMSNEAWGTADTTLTGLRLIDQHRSAFWQPCEDACKRWLNTKTNMWAETSLSVSGAATQTTLQLLQICTAVPESRILMHGLY